MLNSWYKTSVESIIWTVRILYLLLSLFLRITLLLNVLNNLLTLSLYLIYTFCLQQSAFCLLSASDECIKTSLEVRKRNIFRSAPLVNQLSIALSHSAIKLTSIRAVDGALHCQWSLCGICYCTLHASCCPSLLMSSFSI